MFQIIYRRIYLLYVLVDSVGNSKEPPIHSLTVFVTFGLFLSVTASPHWAFHQRAGEVVVGPYGTATEKTSMMQLCCHLRVTNTQWQTIRKGGESSMVSLTNCYDLWVPLASRVHRTCGVYLRSVAAWAFGSPLEEEKAKNKQTKKHPGLFNSKYVNM